MRSDDLRIEIFDDLAAAQNRWKTHEAGLRCTVFQSLALVEQWVSAARPHRRFTPQVVMVSASAGDVLLILPLCLGTKDGLRQLTFLADDVSDYEAPLISPDFAQACPPGEFARLFSRILAQLPKVDIVSFKRMPETVEEVANPLTTLPGVEAGLCAYSARLPESFERFLDRKRRKIHSDSRRQLNRLAERGQVTFRRAGEAEDIEAVVEVMLQQKLARFPQKPGPSLDSRLAFARAFYTGIGALKSPESEGHVTSLSLDGRMLATHVGLTHRGRFYYVMPGFDLADGARYSAGRLLMEHLIQSAIASRMSVFDLTIGNEGYKKDWVDCETPLLDLTHGVSAAGRAWCTLRRVARQARRAWQATFAQAGG